MKYRIIRILDILIETSYLAIVFLTPVYFAVFLENNNVFELNKMVLFRILALLLFLFSFIKVVICRKLFPKEFQFFIKIKFLLVPLLFLLALTLSTLFSIDSSTSFYGLYSRQEGLDSYFYYFLFFVLVWSSLRGEVPPTAGRRRSNSVARCDNHEIASSPGCGRCSRNGRKINRIIWTAVLSSALASIYGLVQIAGYDFMDWSEPAFLTGRITSTLGQPNFLASYLLLVIPLSVYLFFKSRKFLVRFFLGIIFIFQLLALFFTYSRSGWIGFMAGLAVAGIAYWLIIRKRALKSIFGYQKLSFLVIILAVLITGGIFLVNNNSLLKARIKSMADIKSGSNSVRLNFWRASLDAIKKRPIFGYGLETQGEVFSKYYKKNWAVFGAVNVYPNRAHNLFLDIMLTAGFIGLIFYLALLYLFFKLILNNLKNSNNKALSLAILAAISGYLASLMFGFSIVVTNIYFWLYFAIMVVVNYSADNKQENITINRKSSWLSGLIFLVLAVVISGIVFYKIKGEVKYLIADHYFKALERARVEKNYFNALELYSYIKEERAHDRYYDKQFAVILADWLLEIKEPMYRKLGEEILIGILDNIKANNYSDIFTKAKVYTALASKAGEEFFNLAEDNFKAVIQLSPEMPKNYRALAKMYAKQGNYQKAISSHQKALSLLPALNNPDINIHRRNIIQHEKYLIYKDLGDLHLKQTLFARAEKYYWLALTNYISDITLYKKIANTYYLRGDLEKAILYNKKGLALNPDDYAWPFAIALLYEEKGDKVKAIEYVEEALKLAPENGRIKEFLNKLIAL